MKPRNLITTFAATWLLAGFIPAQGTFMETSLVTHSSKRIGLEFSIYGNPNQPVILFAGRSVQVGLATSLGTLYLSGAFPVAATRTDGEGVANVGMSFNLADLPGAAELSFQAAVGSRKGPSLTNAATVVTGLDNGDRLLSLYKKDDNPPKPKPRVIMEMIARIQYLDTDGDKKFDKIRHWTDGAPADGKWDTMLDDCPIDGKFDAGKRDTKGDGKFDQKWVDKNADGLPDVGEWVNITPEDMNAPPYPGAN